MPPVGLKPTISAGERPQTCALDRAATGTAIIIIIMFIKERFLSYAAVFLNLCETAAR